MSTTKSCSIKKKMSAVRGQLKALNGKPGADAISTGLDSIQSVSDSCGHGNEKKTIVALLDKASTLTHCLDEWDEVTQEHIERWQEDIDNIIAQHVYSGVGLELPTEEEKPMAELPAGYGGSQGVVRDGDKWACQEQKGISMEPLFEKQPRKKGKKKQKQTPNNPYKRKIGDLVQLLNNKRHYIDDKIVDELIEVGGQMRLRPTLSKSDFNSFKKRVNKLLK